MIKTLVLATVAVSGVSAFGGAALAKAYFYSYATGFPDSCKANVGDVIPSSCCHDGAAPAKQSDHVQFGCTKDDVIPNYFYGLTCEAGSVNLKDNCDPACGKCESNFAVAEGTCVYTAPVDGTEWVLFLKPNSC